LQDLINAKRHENSRKSQVPHFGFPVYTEVCLRFERDWRSWHFEYDYCILWQRGTAHCVHTYIHTYIPVHT